MGGDLNIGGAGFFWLSSASLVGTGSLSKGQVVVVPLAEPGESVVSSWFSLLGVEGLSEMWDGFAGEGVVLFP